MVMTGDPVVRLLGPADLEEALLLSSTAGWNQQRADWQMLLTLAPSGSFAAIVGDRIVATAIGIDYGGFGWIAMMLVDPAYRGRGFGRRLLEAAMDAIPGGKPIRLDATPMGRPLYASCGFEHEATLNRYVAEPSSRRIPPATPGVQRITVDALASIVGQDAAVFGGQRGAVLEWALGRTPQYAWTKPAPGTPASYCFGRQGRLFDQIGPIVAPDDETARGLVGAAAAGAEGRAVVIDAFDARTGFATWLRDCGFRVERPLFRMQRAGSGGASYTPSPGEGHLEYAIFGPEFA
jgi:GNAT superfamily N-acetyltransferase